jgi:AraC-like DNA-binding protein
LLDVSSAAQRFLLSVLPLSSDTSPRAVCEFCEALHALNLGRVTTEGMIVGILRKLEAAVGVTDQMMLTQYFALESSTPDQCSRLRICVERLVRTHAAAHPAVAGTLRMTDECYADSRFSLEVAARRLHISPSHLSHLISFHTGERFRRHLRAVRMRAAATRLSGGMATIHEVAAAVGYAHLADFDHHFKAHFGTTPSGYRAQLSMSGAATIPAKWEPSRSLQPAARGAAASPVEVKPRLLDSSGKAHVLIVEDDRTSLAFARVLNDAGYDVAVTADTTTGCRLFRRHSPLVTIAGSAINPRSILSFVRRVRPCCSSRQSFALVTADAVLTKHQEKELAELEVTIAFKPLLPREIVGLVSRLLACA